MLVLSRLSLILPCILLTGRRDYKLPALGVRSPIGIFQYRLEVHTLDDQNIFSPPGKQCWGNGNLNCNWLYLITRILSNYKLKPYQWVIWWVSANPTLVVVEYCQSVPPNLVQAKQLMKHYTSQPHMYSWCMQYNLWFSWHVVCINRWHMLCINTWWQWHVNTQW